MILIQKCELSKCEFPVCECKRLISHRRAGLSYEYRRQLRVILINKIEELAEKSALSKSAVAKQIGLVGSQYSRMIHGDGANVTVDSLVLFLERMGVRVSLCFDDLEQAPGAGAAKAVS